MVPSRTRHLAAHLLVLAASLLSLALPRTASGQVDPTTSFYVPQSGPVATPTEGAGATRFFTQCPNNDFSPLINNSARIKIVVKDATGAPIPAIPAASICILLNGGTSAQGLAGVGADSVIANAAFNSNPPCPDLRCIAADGPTDAVGVTYITFAGTAPGVPGVAVRDPARKWGHYDSELPVYVTGVQLSGRLTSASPNGSYVLRIRNLDLVDGLEATLDAGEYVSPRDVNVVRQELLMSNSLTYWLDFDGNGQVNALDFNSISAHQGHDCTHPNNP